MASTGFNAISQAAEILGRQLIDEKSRHFILDLLTRTLGENIQLQDSLIKKEYEIEGLQAKIQEKDDNAERALGENAEVIKQLEKEIKGYKENWQRQFQQIQKNHQLIENHEASIEYLQEQVKEKDDRLVSYEEIKKDLYALRGAVARDRTRIRRSGGTRSDSDDSDDDDSVLLSQCAGWNEEGL